MGEDTQKYKVARLTQTEGTQLTENTYNLAIGGVLLWGIALNVLMATVFRTQILSLNFGLVLVLYLVLGFGGTIVVFRSEKPAVSFLGFTLLAIGMGIIVTFIVAEYSGSTVYSAFLMTGIVTVIMMIASTLYPALFLRMGSVLGIALIGSIVIELIGGLLLRIPMTFMDYALVVIFAGFIGFDWAKAQIYPKTLDNAIDSAADIYVDIINIFSRILSIMGKKDN